MDREAQPEHYQETHEKPPYRPRAARCSSYAQHEQDLKSARLPSIRLPSRLNAASREPSRVLPHKLCPRASYSFRPVYSYAACSEGVERGRPTRARTLDMHGPGAAPRRSWPGYLPPPGSPKSCPRTRRLRAGSCAGSCLRTSRRPRTPFAHRLTPPRVERSGPARSLLAVRR